MISLLTAISKSPATAFLAWLLELSWHSFLHLPMPAGSIYGKPRRWNICIIWQVDGDLAIVTSQPRFDIVPVTEPEIDAWFAAQGFQKVARSGYYRSVDNLGVFDAHDKNVVRAGEFLVPFDIIPCRPDGGFLKFIEDTLAAGHTVRAVRTVSTSK